MKARCARTSPTCSSDLRDRETKAHWHANQFGRCLSKRSLRRDNENDLYKTPGSLLIRNACLPCPPPSNSHPRTVSETRLHARPDTRLALPPNQRRIKPSFPQRGRVGHWPHKNWAKRNRYRDCGLRPMYLRRISTDEEAHRSSVRRSDFTSRRLPPLVVHGGRGLRRRPWGCRGAWQRGRRGFPSCQWRR